MTFDQFRRIQSRRAFFRDAAGGIGTVALAAVLASPRVFTPAGQSGIEFSDFIPHTASCADDMCLVRSMYSDAFNHHPGQLLLFSGTMQFGRPTFGAWVLYGLGSESQNLPGF